MGHRWQRLDQLRGTVHFPASRRLPERENRRRKEKERAEAAAQKQQERQAKLAKARALAAQREKERQRILEQQRLAERQRLAILQATRDRRLSYQNPQGVAPGVYIPAELLQVQNFKTGGPVGYTQRWSSARKKSKT